MKIIYFWLESATIKCLLVHHLLQLFRPDSIVKFYYYKSLFFRKIKHGLLLLMGVTITMKLKALPIMDHNFHFLQIDYCTSIVQDKVARMQHVDPDRCPHHKHQYPL